ncbi:glycosyl hydrolase family 28-related protein [Ornithinibacillus xuwenensis]|uniref:Glycosyl hydrolase family 28-related protein n=1 Tax=Ornithinibacillus xuwenensis TaxID=3144668 RepID=A0ABU9XFB5_9BACI
MNLVNRINIKDFGAVGDGVTDDSKAFQYALNLAREEGAVDIYVPSGIYRWGSPIVLYSNSSITSAPQTVFLRGHNASMIQNGTSSDNFTGYNGNGNITINGGIFDCNLEEIDDDCSVFQLSHAENLNFINLTIKDVFGGHAFDLSGVRNVVIDRCSFLGYRDFPDGSRNYSEAIQLDLQTSGGFPLFGEHDNTPTYDVTVSNCYFGQSGTNNTTSWPTCIGHHSSVHNKWVHTVYISNNIFENTVNSAIRLIKNNNVLIENNTFNNCNSFIEMNISNNDVQSANSIAIKNNYFNGIVGENNPITIIGNEFAQYKDIEISSNTFKNILGGSGAIYSNYSNGLKILYNRFFDCARAAWVLNSEDVMIANNSADTCIYEMLYCQNIDNLYITSNIVNSSGRAGINLAGVKKSIVEANIARTTSAETTNLRSGIVLSTNCDDVLIKDNKISLSNNKYGLEVTGSCTNIQSLNNNVQGIEGPISIPVNSGFDGLVINSVNGTKYKMTIDDNGSPEFSQLI